jgi:hypothetical protein
MSVLRQQTSHLLPIRTNLGCETLLTAACARQGCSTTHYYYYYYYYYYYLVNIMIYEDPLYAVFSSLLLLSLRTKISPQHPFLLLPQSAFSLPSHTPTLKLYPVRSVCLRPRDNLQNAATHRKYRQKQRQ